MGGGGTNTTTSTSTSQPTNPDVQATASKLAQGISKAYDTGPQVFNESLYNPAGSTTQNAWQAALGAAGNQDYANSVNSAIKSFGDVAAGKQFGQAAPGYATLRNNVMNDTLAATNKSFNSAGLFGSDSNQQAAGTGVANALAGLDYGNYQNDIARQQQAATMLPGLFSAAQQPSTVMGAIGGAMDQNNQGILQGRYDLASRQANSWTDLIAKLTSAAAGNAASSGMTTVNSETRPATPWYQSLLGIGLQAL